MKLDVYGKDEAGFVTYLGAQQWESESQFWEYYFRDEEPGQIERLIGWPHAAVEWRRGCGLAVMP